MFAPMGPSVRELAVQAMSSIERGYDLLAPKFDHTPFRTPDRMLDAVEETLAQAEGSFGAGLDVCCGTGAAMGMLRRLCRERVTGVDFSAGMLAEAERAHGTAGGPAAGGAGRGPDEGPAVDFVRADARALPAGLAASYDLAVSFGAFGHFLPAERPALFGGVHGALRPGGVFAFPVSAPLPMASPFYWATAGFDAVMRVRNAVWRPTFVMYYRTFPFGGVREDLRRAGFTVETLPLEQFGRRPDGTPNWRLVLARKP
ncbi:class I SAM-dependent methyltransferase [Streptomyces sp. NPDC051211]|uniref:class I SAM-dependent methyltransferase n=1 Tax=Streptomyces sp. NPDC051211 TaxID=3154643 RepID=UPI00344CD49B